MNHKQGDYTGFLFTALSMASVRKNSPVPEMMYILKPDQILSLIKIFGNRSVDFPHPEEFTNDMMCALAVYWVYMKGKDWSYVEELLSNSYGVDGNWMRSIRSRHNKWLQYLDDQGIKLPQILKEAYGSDPARSEAARA